MVKAIRANKRVLQVGSQQRSQSSFHRACTLIRNGYIGKVTRVIASFVRLLAVLGGRSEADIALQMRYYADEEQRFDLAWCRCAA